VSKRSIQEEISSTTSRRHRQLVLIARSAAQKHCAVKEQAVARSFDDAAVMLLDLGIG